MDRNAPAYDAPRYIGSGRLAGRKAFILGGATGIGRAVVRLFAREGADVAIGYHSDREEAEHLAALCAEEGATTMLVRVDASRRDSCFQAADEVAGAFGRIDVLVCNSSIQTFQKDVTAISEDQATRTMTVNVLGYLWTVQAALPHMHPGGAIVCTTSVNAYRGHPQLVDYSASKGAELALVRSLALNLIDRGIRVNAVAPGPIWTPLVAETMEPGDLPEFGTDVPMKRPGQPCEVAPAFLFLACEDASYVTGQVIHPNGGIPVGS